MPKGQTRYLVSADPNWLYNSPDELPWEEIQRVAGKTFSLEERKEIFGCTIPYSTELSFLDAGSATKEVVNLKCRILRHAEEAIEIAKTYNAFDRATDQTDVKQKALIDLMLMNARPGDPFHLMEELRDAADTARRIIDGLEAEPVIRYESTSRQARPVALAHFIANALRGASRRPARSAKLGAYEYRRWGIPIGPRSKDFLSFVNAALQLDLTLEQLKEPFSEARRVACLDAPDMN